MRSEEGLPATQTRFVLRGVIINGFLKYLITKCAGGVDETRGSWEEDDATVSFAEKQGVRLRKSQQTITDPMFEVTCGEGRTGTVELGFFKEYKNGLSLKP